MEKVIIRIVGPIILVLFGDTAVFDRWLWLRRHLKSGSVRTLDAGCGSGALTIYAARRGNEAIGISFDKRNNEVAKERAKLLNAKKATFLTGDLCKLDELSGELGKFDQIICFETIEHIMNDRKLLRDFSGILNLDGRLILTAPYKHYKRIMGNTISEVENGDHVRWGYTHEEIERLLNEVGLKIEIRDYVTGFVSQWLILIYRWLSNLIHYKLAWPLLFPFRFFIIFDPILTKLLSYPYFSIAVVARKK